MRRPANYPWLVPANPQASVWHVICSLLVASLAHKIEVRRMPPNKGALIAPSSPGHDNGDDLSHSLVVLLKDTNACERRMEELP